jgi:cell wall-associated NlpC family hydrolase
MQKILVPIRIFFFLIVTAFLSSCTSSSYVERYKTTEKTDTNVNNNSIDDEVEEIDIAEINTSSKEIIDRFIPLTGTNKKKKKFLYELAKYIKVPYKYGGETKSGIDCSAFTQQVYKNSLNVNLPRTAREQYNVGERIRSVSKLKFGDLVYFNTSQIYYPGHVGIYLGDKLFVHASASKGVIVSSLENTYFSNRYIGATRIKVKRKHN